MPQYDSIKDANPLNTSGANVTKDCSRHLNLNFVVFLLSSLWVLNQCHVLLLAHSTCFKMRLTMFQDAIDQIRIKIQVFFNKFYKKHIFHLLFPLIFAQLYATHCEVPFSQLQPYLKILGDFRQKLSVDCSFPANVNEDCQLKARSYSWPQFSLFELFGWCLSKQFI